MYHYWIRCFHWQSRPKVCRATQQELLEMDLFLINALGYFILISTFWKTLAPWVKQVVCVSVSAFRFLLPTLV